MILKSFESFYFIQNSREEYCVLLEYMYNGKPILNKYILLNMQSHSREATVTPRRRGEATS